MAHVIPLPVLRNRGASMVSEAAGKGNSGYPPAITPVPGASGQGANAFASSS